MARILLTGATGFVGGRLAARLRQRGDEVRAVVRTPSRHLETIGVDQRAVCLDGVDVQLLGGIDGIAHAAAATGPDLASARRVNRDGTARVVAAALAAPVSPRLVHVSTTSVYDLQAVGDAEVDENAPLVVAGAEAPPASSSGSDYAVTKAEAEHEVAAGAAAGLSVAVLRPAAVLGAGPTSAWGTRVPTRLLAGEGWPRPADTTYAWVHVEDLVDAIVAALDHDAERAVNVIGGQTTVRTYLDAVAARLPGQIQVTAGPGEPWQGRYATDALPATFGVHPARSFDQAMDEIADSWADGPPG